jgi:hypothetical protein
MLTLVLGSFLTSRSKSKKRHTSRASRFQNRNTNVSLPAAYRMVFRFGV